VMETGLRMLKHRRRHRPSSGVGFARDGALDGHPRDGVGSRAVPAFFFLAFCPAAPSSYRADRGRRRPSVATFSGGKIVADNPQAPGVEIGRPGESYRRLRISTDFGALVVLATDGHLPYPCGRKILDEDGRSGRRNDRFWARHCRGSLQHLTLQIEDFGHAPQMQPRRRDEFVKRSCWSTRKRARGWH
jgi:hypothetical protein